MTTFAMDGRSGEEYRALISRLLQSANRGMPLAAFLEDATGLLLDASRASAAVLRLEEWTPRVRFRAIRTIHDAFRFETEVMAPESQDAAEPPQAAICRALLRGLARGPSSCLTPRGSFYSGDAQESAPFERSDGIGVPVAAWARGGGFRSLVLIPFRVEGRAIGLIQFVDARADRFRAADVHFFEDVAEALGLALSHHRAQWALHERVKELTCLYGIAEVARDTGASGRELFDRIARLLPPGWQYPQDCVARIVLDGAEHTSAGFVESPWMQSAEIRTEGRQRGRVDVGYLVEKPAMSEGPFLAEERSLINEVARQIGLIVEAREAEGDRARLTAQLLHADRLATIGKLTAGVAHELNEPLGSILGFAQLSLDSGSLPHDAVRDSERIVQAALHAREIIRKLMFFGRQTPPGKSSVDLNRVVQDGLGLLEPRLTRQGVHLSLRLDAELPQVVADPAQLLQVVMNLTINAVQAMPEGGDLRIVTECEASDVLFSVEDTGMGMTEEVRSQAFLPFFTTKDVGEGTGLGLSVAHGIVAAHGGRIEVKSEPGNGSRFVVRLPLTRGGL